MSTPAVAGDIAGDGDGCAAPDSPSAPSARALLYGEPLLDLPQSSASDEGATGLSGEAQPSPPPEPPPATVWVRTGKAHI